GDPYKTRVTEFGSITRRQSSKPAHEGHPRLATHRKIQSSLSRLELTWKASCSPIIMATKLPFELIVDVLLLVCQGVDQDKGSDHIEAVKSRLHVSQICSVWRESAIVTCRFWTNMTWVMKVSTTLGGRRPWETPKQKYHNLLDVLEIFMDRSSDAPIDLWVSLFNDLALEKRVWGIIAPHVHRCRSLMLLRPYLGSVLDNIFPLRGRFPHLTHLRVGHLYKVPRIFELNDAAPHLLHLSLDNGEIETQNELKERHDIRCLAFTHEDEWREVHYTPYWDAVDRAFMDRTRGRGPSAKSEPDAVSALPSDPTGLVLRLQHTKLRGWLELLPALEHVVLVKMKMTSTVMQLIGELPHLQSLTFVRCHSVWFTSALEDRFPLLEHLTFQECEDLGALESLAFYTENLPALRRFTSRFTRSWKPRWKKTWTNSLQKVLRGRPYLVFEWIYTTPSGRSRRPFWSVDAVEDVADRLLNMRADEVDEFHWVEPY
ncbi:hypothetical protein DL93DRAFT_1970913, partial [Clavulina sp. PMI_390]